MSSDVIWLGVEVQLYVDATEHLVDVRCLWQGAMTHHSSDMFQRFQKLSHFFASTCFSPSSCARIMKTQETQGSQDRKYVFSVNRVPGMRDQDPSPSSTPHPLYMLSALMKSWWCAIFYLATHTRQKLLCNMKNELWHYYVFVSFSFVNHIVQTRIFVDQKSWLLVLHGCMNMYVRN